MKMKSGLSSSMEDYLREIYVLTQKNDEVRDRCCTIPWNIQAKCQSGDEYVEGAGIYRT